MTPALNNPLLSLSPAEPMWPHRCEVAPDGKMTYAHAVEDLHRADLPAPAMGHQVQEVDGKPQYFQTDDDKPALSSACASTSTSDLTPVAGHDLILTGLDGPDYLETGDPTSADIGVRGLPSANEGDLTPIAAHFIEGSPNDDPEYVVSPDPDPGPEPRVSLNTPLAIHWSDVSSSGSFAYVKCDPDGPSVYTGSALRGPVFDVTDEDRSRAAQFNAHLWEYIIRAGGPRPATQAHHHFPAAFPVRWLAILDLPSRTSIPKGQAVTLTGPGFTRYPDHSAMLADYQANPRTWVFERVNWSIPWLNYAARYLTEMTASRYDVLAAVYDSRATDRPSDPHIDAWYSAIIQIDGAKQWILGPDRQQVTTLPGDILCIPEGLAHAVGTPDDPGHSRHLVFDLAIHTLVTTACD